MTLTVEHPATIERDPGDPGRRFDGPRSRALRSVIAHPVTHATVLIGVLGSLFLNTKTVWFDEAISAGIGRGSWTAWYAGVAADGGSQSLYFLALKLTAFLGDEPWAIRLPALVFAMAVPYPLWRLVEPRFGRFIATRALLITAVSASFIAMAQEARAYTALTAVITWSWFCLDQALTTQSRKFWLVTGVLTALSLYAQPLGVPIVMAQVVWVLVNRGAVAWRYLMGAGAITAVLAVPFVYLTVFRALDFTSWLGTLSLHGLVHFAGAPFGLLRLQQAMVLSMVGTGLAASLALLAVAPTIGTSQRRRESLLFLLWLAVPTLVLVIGGLVRAYLLTRYAVPLVPAGATLAAIGVERVRELAGHRVARLSFLVLIVSLAVRTFLSYNFEHYPWTRVQPYVAEHSTPADMVAFEPAFFQVPFEYYTLLNGDAETIARPMPPGGMADDGGWGPPRHPYLEFYPETTVPAPEGDLWIVVWGGSGLNSIGPTVDRLDVEMVEVERIKFNDMAYLVRFTRAG